MTTATDHHSKVERKAELLLYNLKLLYSPHGFSSLQFFPREDVVQTEVIENFDISGDETKAVSKINVILWNPALR